MTPQELEALQMLLAQTSQGTGVAPDYAPNMRAQTYEQQAGRMEQDAAQPMARPQGFKENAVSGIRAFIEGMANPRDPFAGMHRREEMHMAGQQQKLARAKELRQQAMQQQALGSQANERSQDLDFRNRQLAETQRLREIQEFQARKPDMAQVQPGASIAISDPATGDVRFQTAPGTRPQDITMQHRDRKEGGKVFREYFHEADPSTVVYTAELGQDTSMGNEPGSYQPVFDPRGMLLGWYNPKTRQRVGVEEAGFGDRQLFKGAMTPDRQAREAGAASGLSAIQKFKQELAKNPNMLAQLAVPGSPGARAALAAKKEMVDVLTRIRTGAALNQDEQVFYNSQAPGLLDTLLDDPETVMYKLSIFEQNYLNMAPQHVGEAYKTGKPIPGIFDTPGQTPAAQPHGGGLIKPGGALEALINRK